jgi:hypothetical protein
MSMVLGSDKAVAVGSRRVGCYDAQGILHANQPYLVVREVDESAWREWNASMGNINPRRGFGDGARFYEVATD